MRAAIIFSLICSTLISCTSAKTSSTDIDEKFNLVTATASEMCPKVIKQTTYMKGSPEEVWVLPHNTIIHDGKRCDSYKNERKLKYYHNSLIPSAVPEGLKKMLKSNGLIVDIKYKLDSVLKSYDTENYYVGYENKRRYCNDDSKFDKGTVMFLFRPYVNVKIPIKDEMMIFRPGSKFLIIVPRYSNNACIYSTAVSVKPKKPKKPKKMKKMKKPSVAPKATSKSVKASLAPKATKKPVIAPKGRVAPRTEICLKLVDGSIVHKNGDLLTLTADSKLKRIPCK